jgi:predicted ATP-grasp superfamily ATP-dependent carboligase
MPLVQERIEGDESRLYSVYVYLDRRSEPRATCVVRKVRQWPPLYGSGSYSVSCREDRAVALALTLLQGWGYQGVANVEFKQDPRDGAFKLIEVNARGGERIALALAAGVDLPYVAYRDILGEPAPAARTYEPGVSWISALNDCAAVLSHYRQAERLSWWRWGWSALTARSHAYFAWDDPLPFLGHLVKAARRHAVPFLRSWASGDGRARGRVPPLPSAARVAAVPRQPARARPLVVPAGVPERSRPARMPVQKQPLTVHENEQH